MVELTKEEIIRYRPKVEQAFKRNVSDEEIKVVIEQMFEFWELFLDD